ncbi:hypothetical protein MMC13_000217 [Lambiella insularis]|nr:hypothetical protein [Lambiella insularis]
MPSAVGAPPKASRNVLNVVLGDIVFKTWYPSFYPEELVGKELERLYVCPWCFKYSKDAKPFLAHVDLCSVKGIDPPGKVIYSKAPYSIYEVDGEEDKLFTQNLSLFAKLFLDNKSVFFDVSSFNYYLLVQESPSPSGHQAQVVGFFSKEKMSWDNNNLACILVFPPWQRQGLGKILMGVSYELSRREGRVGGPEKPLSELGRRGYSKFWASRVAAEILSMRNKSTVTAEGIAQQCWMLVDDVLAALKEMELLEARMKGAGLVVTKHRIREWVHSRNVDLSPPVYQDHFLAEWVPEIDDSGDISGYFKKVCNGSFKEAKELEITLLEDDPEIVNQMVDYLYCSSYEFVEKDKKQKGHPDLDAIPHAKVYAIAEKYQISSLKYLAKEKAKAGFQKLWDGDQFSALIDFVWNTTPETDDHEGLRSEITDFIVAQKSQIYKKGALLESLKDKGELAVKILSGVSCEIERYEIGYSKLW